LIAAVVPFAVTVTGPSSAPGIEFVGMLPPNSEILLT
jgi:hypothetical protein